MGLATARVFVEAGAAVVIADIYEATLGSARTSWQPPATRSSAFGVTCPTRTAVAVMVKTTVDTFGRLECPYVISALMPQACEPFPA
jgi:NAD(P)-dependent dehydrogenase (short-subunit alcohol dehydrogenase family)